MQMKCEPELKRYIVTEEVDEHDPDSDESLEKWQSAIIRKAAAYGAKASKSSYARKRTAEEMVTFPQIPLPQDIPLGERAFGIRLRPRPLVRGRKVLNFKQTNSACRRFTVAEHFPQAKPLSIDPRTPRGAPPGTRVVDVTCSVCGVRFGNHVIEPAIWANAKYDINRLRWRPDICFICIASEWSLARTLTRPSHAPSTTPQRRRGSRDPREPSLVHRCTQRCACDPRALDSSQVAAN